MKSIRKILEEELDKYEQMLAIVENKEKKIDGVSLEVISKNNRHYYSIRKRENGKISREKIVEEELYKARNLAQRSYNSKIEKILLNIIKCFNVFLNKYNEDIVDDIYNNLCLGRKELVVPICPTHEDYIESWLSENYDGLTIEFKNQDLITKNGELVRSKTEKILADMFHDLGIRYKYECPFYLSDGYVLYPDFTFIHPITKQEIYWEHHGRMDDPNYVMATLKKINQYAKEGILIGDRLIVTFEGGDIGANFKMMGDMARKLLLVED